MLVNIPYMEHMGYMYIYIYEYGVDEGKMRPPINSRIANSSISKHPILSEFERQIMVYLLVRKIHHTIDVIVISTKNRGDIQELGIFF